jgi:hypothetical protein
MILYALCVMFLYFYFTKKFLNMILGDKPLISEVVLSQFYTTFFIVVV